MKSIDSFIESKEMKFRLLNYDTTTEPNLSR